MATTSRTSRWGMGLLAALLAAAVVAPATAARAAAPTDLVISEYVEGSSLNKALELFNGTGETIDLSGYVLEIYFNGNDTTGNTVDLAGSVSTGDVWVVADDGFTGPADQVDSGNFWNGDDVVIIRGPGGEVVDSMGTLGVDPGSSWGTPSTQNNTLRRNADVCTGDTVVDDTFDPSVEWTGHGNDVFDGLGSHTVDCDGGGDPTVVINEFSASTTGTDVEYVEVLGPADTDLSNLTVLQVEGDSGSPNFGTVIGDDPVGTTDAEGFFLVDPPSPALQNGTMTVLLVQDWTGETDVTGDLGTVVDSVGVHDGDGGDETFGDTELDALFDGDANTFPPGGASRIQDGIDTDSRDDWARNDFNLAGIEPGDPAPGEAYNTPGAPNAVNEDTGGGGGECGDPTVTIGSVQGDGDASPVEGQVVEIEGTVVGDFQTGGFDGYYVQDGGDADPATSDGIFVFDEDSEVSTGDVVHVTGSVSEFFGMTEVTPGDVQACSSGNDLPAPAEVTIPEGIDDLADFPGFERFEGMYVTFPQDLAILEYFNYDRFGEIVLGTQRQFQPTAVFEPNSPEADALATYNATARITLDDGLSTQNPEVTRHPNGDPFTLDNRFRGGDLVANATGVLDFRFDLYRIQPTQGADVTVSNPRPDVPEVGGSATVAAFNVLNYFTSIDDGTNVCPDPSVGPDAGCRGADTVEEFERQEAKIVAALAAMDADVVGLVEIENDDESVAALVDALNAGVGTGTYAHVSTGPIGTDAIKVGFIYKPATVSPVGDFAILDQSVDERFLDDKNRPTLAQTFEEIASGATVTVAVNHLKSKGSSCEDVGDPDDPVQGNCNGVRTDAAAALADWMADDPTGSGADNQLVIGDLNSYDEEDPIDVLAEADWSDLLGGFGGEQAYSYVFDGQLGYLDYALANPAVANEVTGTAAWHAHTDEPDLIDYDMTFKSDGQDAIYAPDAYRASDHDAVLVGLDMEPVDTTPPDLAVSLSPDVLGAPNHQYVDVTATIEVSDDLDDDVEVELVSATSNEPDNGRGDGNTVDDIVVVNDTELRVRAERSGLGDGRVYTFVWEATDDAGNTTTASATVLVPKGR